MKLTVYTGKNCPKCPDAKNVCKDLIRERGGEFEELDIEENMIEALQKQIASTPTILINGAVVFRGHVPTKTELIKEVEKI